MGAGDGCVQPVDLETQTRSGPDAGSQAAPGRRPAEPPTGDRGSGLAAALLLRRAGWEVALHEASDAAGGLLKPVRFRGLDCDLGSHRLHPEALNEPLLAELAGPAQLQQRPRRGRIVLQGRHLPYPLNMPGLLAGLGLRQALAFCGGLLRQQAEWHPGVSPCEDEGFEAYVVHRVGRAAYDAFYRPYAEKVWGLDPATLSQTVARQRVSTARPLTQLAQTLRRPLGVHRTFLYPQRGMAGLHGALLQKVRDAGVEVEFGRPFQMLTSTDADVVVHSGHLRHLLQSPTELAHRGLYLLFLALPVGRLHPVETWYTPEARYWFGRVSEVGNYSPSMANPGETALCLEIPEGRWGAGVDFVQHVDALVEQLHQARILPPGVKPTDAQQAYVPDVYPLYRRGWRDTWRVALETVAAAGRVLPIGRQGLYLHCNIDHAMAIARTAVAHLQRGGGSQDWLKQALAWQGVQVRD